MAVEIYTCQDCGLIYDAEALNLVSGSKEGLVGNYCPHCGGDNLDEGFGSRRRKKGESV